MKKQELPKVPEAVKFIFSKEEMNLFDNYKMTELLAFKTMAVNKVNEFLLVDLSIEIKGKIKKQVKELKVQLTELENMYNECQPLINPDYKLLKSDENSKRVYISNIMELDRWYSPSTSEYKPFPLNNMIVEGIISNAYKLLSRDEFESILDEYDGVYYFGMYKAMINNDNTVSLVNPDISEILEEDYKI